MPLGGGLVLVTGAWTALAMRWLGHAHALALDAGAALLDLAVVLLAGVVLGIYAPAAWRVALGPLGGLAFALPVASPVAAAVWHRPRGAAQAEPV